MSFSQGWSAERVLKERAMMERANRLSPEDAAAKAQSDSIKAVKSASTELKRAAIERAETLAKAKGTQDALALAKSLSKNRNK